MKERQAWLRIKARLLAPAFNTKHLGAEGDLIALFRRKRAGSQRKPEHALWLGEPLPYFLTVTVRECWDSTIWGRLQFVALQHGLLLLLHILQALTALFNSSKGPRHCVRVRSNDHMQPAVIFQLGPRSQWSIFQSSYPLEPWGRASHGRVRE